MSKTDESYGTVRISEDGRALIPAELREESGIETPGRVRFRKNENGEVVVEPVPRPSEMRGAGKEKVEGDVEEALERVRKQDSEAEKERERRLLGSNHS
jgi:bifunctional DNA-binding transcriptional regulator/antitoxin component of YhaV-PrlF toxin-antitoxin module